MDDIELLGRIYQLVNQCEACDALLIEQRSNGQVTRQTESYAQWCADEFSRLHQQAVNSPDRGLLNAIQRELKVLVPFIISFNLGLPARDA